MIGDRVRKLGGRRNLPDAVPAVKGNLTFRGDGVEGVLLQHGSQKQIAVLQGKFHGRGGGGILDLAGKGSSGIFRGHRLPVQGGEPYGNHCLIPAFFRVQYLVAKGLEKIHKQLPDRLRNGFVAVFAGKKILIGNDLIHIAAVQRRKGRQLVADKPDRIPVVGNGGLVPVKKSCRAGGLQKKNQGNSDGEFSVFCLMAEQIHAGQASDGTAQKSRRHKPGFPDPPPVLNGPALVGEKQKKSGGIYDQQVKQ